MSLLSKLVTYSCQFTFSFPSTHRPICKKNLGSACMSLHQYLTRHHGTLCIHTYDTTSNPADLRLSTPSSLAEGTHDFLLDWILGSHKRPTRRYAHPAHVPDVMNGDACSLRPAIGAQLRLGVKTCCQCTPRFSTDNAQAAHSCGRRDRTVRRRRYHRMCKRILQRDRKVYYKTTTNRGKR